MTAADREAYNLRMQQNMQAMSPEQMAERARQQAVGMQNSARLYRPEQAHNMRNMWPHDANMLAGIAPNQLPPLTWRQRFNQWLSRFWS